MRISPRIARALVVLLIAVLGLCAVFAVLVLPTSTEVESTATHWRNVPTDRKAEVTAVMECEQDVFRATFDQRGRDIALSLMVLHPMSRGRADHLGQTFMDQADKLARQYVEQEVENADPSDPAPHRYTVRIFSKNEAAPAGTTPEGEFTILEWER